ncbi:hypothetical protein [Marinivivus vitaminiproducens]|uniref:hypothetical protein n=1 Tax=Marinivivus vitaminiproducens TaxID=3035935 RepID=UPI00279DDABF|nr:hypothetical protein P4R82_23400 [Geminicoccaceae bacterium SCSIO 64248]
MTTVACMLSLFGAIAYVLGAPFNVVVAGIQSAYLLAFAGMTLLVAGVGYELVTTRPFDRRRGVDYGTYLVAMGIGASAIGGLHTPDQPPPAIDPGILILGFVALTVLIRRHASAP